MTEDEAILVHETKNKFWLALGPFVAKYLEMVPHHLQDDLLMQMQDSASLYGSGFTKHMKRPPPFVERYEAVLNGPVGKKLKVKKSLDT